MPGDPGFQPDSVAGGFQLAENLGFQTQVDTTGEEEDKSGAYKPVILSRRR